MDQIPVLDADGDIGPGETLDGLIEEEWTVAFNVSHSIVTIIRFFLFFKKKKKKQKLRLQIVYIVQNRRPCILRRDQEPDSGRRIP